MSPKFLLIVIGNPLNIVKDADWGKFYDFCFKNGATIPYESMRAKPSCGPVSVKTKLFFLFPKK